jgi:DNA polymerase-3 subunit epsilon
MSPIPSHLRLERPLAVIDTETTGLDPRDDRVVEVAGLVLRPGAEPARFSRLVNPGRPIPPAATAVHGIADEDVAAEPPFAAIAPRLARLLEGADLAGFNIARFDLPFLSAEFRRAGVEFAIAGRAVVDVQRIFHRLEPRDLAAAVRRYCGREHDGAHAAMDDAEATAEVLDAQVGRHAELPPTPAGLHALLIEVDVEGRFRIEGDRVCFNFGKHQGRPLDEVARIDAGYLQWLLGQDFLDDVLDLVTRASGRARRGS